jgi:kinesin family protein 5
MAKSLKPPVVRKGKLVVVDLAGSERIDKSGLLKSRNGN